MAAQLQVEAQRKIDSLICVLAYRRAADKHVDSTSQNDASFARAGNFFGTVVASAKTAAVGTKRARELEAREQLSHCKSTLLLNQGRAATTSAIREPNGPKKEEKSFQSASAPLHVAVETSIIFGG